MVILVAAAYRLIFVGMFPLGPDEASYWAWSRRLDFGYVDHPPMVAYAIWLMTRIFGDTYWASRLLACLLASCTSGLMYGAGTRLYGPRVGFWAACFHAASPMYSMAGGIMLLPESLLTFWVALAFRLMSRVIIRGQLTALYPLGLVLGCALLTKYPGALVLGGLGLFALCSPRNRFWFARKEPYLMAMIGLAMFLPVLVWNVRHDWAGIAFISGRTHPTSVEPGIGVAWQSVLSQAGYHSPLVFGLLWYGVAAAGYCGFRRKDDRALLLFCFSAPVIVLFMTIATFRYTLPHWPAAGYLSAYIAAPAAVLGCMGRQPNRSRKRARLVLGTAAGVAGLESALMPVLMICPVTTMFYERLQPRLGLPEEVLEPMAQAYGWDEEIRDHVIAVRNRLIEETGQAPVVLTHDHLQASLLAYGLRHVCEVIAIHARAWQYDIWYDDDDVAGRTVIYVSSEMSAYFDGKPTDFYVFEECTPEPSLPISACGVRINTVHLWVCAGYGGPAGTAPVPDRSGHEGQSALESAEEEQVD